MVYVRLQPVLWTSPPQADGAAAWLYIDAAPLSHYATPLDAEPEPDPGPEPKPKPDADAAFPAFRWVVAGAFEASRLPRAVARSHSLPPSAYEANNQSKILKRRAYVFFFRLLTQINNPLVANGILFCKILNES